MNHSDTTIVIPTLNEGENIKKLIALLNRLYDKINIIVSDDGSTDSTKAAVRSFRSKKIVFFDRSKKRVHGLTASVVDAAKIVKTPYTVVMDGDLQHPPEKVEDIVNLLRENKELVVGVREKDLSDWYLHRMIMSKGALFLGKMKLLSRGIKCSDSISGFFGIRSDIFKRVIEKNEDKYELEGYKVLFDTLKYIPQNTKIAETPYFFGIRKGGDSKINSKHIWLYFRSLFK